MTTPTERPTWTVITDPAELAAANAKRAVAERNLDWLQEHIYELAEGNIGRYVVVAEQQAFFSEDADEAWRLASAAHPAAVGLITYYFFQPKSRAAHATARSVV